MVHTAEDYSDKIFTSIVYSDQDLTELAVRLGCISIHDRRGKILHMDDFEGAVLKWDNAGSGTNNAAQLSSAYALLGSQSCKITTGSTGAKRGGINRLLAYPVKGPMGVEIAATFNDNLSKTEILFELYTGSNLLSAGLQYDFANQNLNYLDSSQSWVKIQDQTVPYEDDQLFHRYKLVIDFSTEKYVRFIYNDAELDLSSLSFGGVANPTGSHLIVYYYTYMAGSSSISTYIDNVIITQVEPL